MTQGAQIPARRVNTQLDLEGIWPTNVPLIFLQCSHQILCYLACLGLMWQKAGNDIA